MPTSVLSEQAPQVPVGTAPIDGPDINTPDLCNRDLEKTDPQLTAALKSIVDNLARQTIVARRWQIRRVRKCELYWQGIQYLWWNTADQQWHLPNEANVFDDTASESGPRYQFVTNVYQAYGLSFIAVVSQDIPTIHFFPEDPNDEDDIQAARAASDVVELIQRNNDPERLFSQMGYHAWTGGLFGLYVRYVADGNRFGWDEMPEYEPGMSQLTPDAFVCPKCGARLTQQQAANGICPECGSQITDNDLQPGQSAQVPQQTGTSRIPRGQEVVSCHGALELDVPIYANEQNEYPYIKWQLEVPRSKLQASYPWIADRISTGSGMDGTNTADDVYARVSRISVKESLPQPVPSDMLYDLVTLTRVWLRPWTFCTVKDKSVQQRLLAMFPDGVFVAFAGTTYAESRNENMDAHWVVRHAMPGEGMNRPGIGDSLMDIQDRVNTYDNIQAETYEYGIPPIYADSEVLNFDALTTQTAEPGTHVPAKAKPGQALSNGFFQPSPSEPPADMVQYKNAMMGDIAQMLTGMYPALFGGDTGSNDTASGIKIQRDQAMGRVGLVWRSFKESWARAMKIAVDEFKNNRTNDVTLASKDPATKPHTISLADLKGDVQAFPEADSTYPRLKSDQRAAVERILNIAADAPEIAQILMEPSNMAIFKSLEGINDLVVPGEDSRNKQLKEIEMLLQGEPIISQTLGTMGPEQNEQPSVQIEPLDRDNFEYEECVRWASSDAGIEAQENNPKGYMNVILHAQAHQKAMGAKAMLAQPPRPPIPMGGKPPGGMPATPQPQVSAAGA